MGIALRSASGDSMPERGKRFGLEESRKRDSNCRHQLILLWVRESSRGVLNGDCQVLAGQSYDKDVRTQYVAVVPARGSSRELPRKNLHVVGGQSLLERAIQSGLRSSRVSSCYVSSDDEEVLALASGYGAKPHRRAAAAATDSARASEVIYDLLGSLRELTPDAMIVYLQPTSPFRTSAHVDKAIDNLESSGVESLVSVVRSQQIPEKSLSVGEKGLLTIGSRGVDPGKNRQEFAMSLHPNGALYLFSIRTFLAAGDIPVVGSLPFLMDRVESIDIDGMDDLILARAVADSARI